MLPQARVERPRCRQFVMRPLLDEFSILHDQHAIRLGCQQQAVRDSNHRASARDERNREPDEAI